ncbi:hypothetical protein l13_05600 [Neisseria weaveri ATCC 51223]|nr:hypothetical protein l13_05600 [Neisseria weaveri ATCC 51223]
MALAGMKGGKGWVSISEQFMIEGNKMINWQPLKFQTA